MREKCIKLNSAKGKEKKKPLLKSSERFIIRESHYRTPGSIYDFAFVLQIKCILFTFIWVVNNFLTKDVSKTIQYFLFIFTNK